MENHPDPATSADEAVTYGGEPLEPWDTLAVVSVDHIHQDTYIKQGDYLARTGEGSAPSEPWQAWAATTDAEVQRDTYIQNGQYLERES